MNSEKNKIKCEYCNYEVRYDLAIEMTSYNRPYPYCPKCGKMFVTDTLETRRNDD